MGIFIPIYPQTLKDRSGQNDSWGYFLIGSIDRSAREVGKALDARTSRSSPGSPAHFSLEAELLHFTTT